MKVLLLAIILSLFVISCWQIQLVKIGQSTSEVQKLLLKRPKGVAQTGEYRFVYYDPPGHGGDYVFIFKNDSLVMFGQENDMPEPDEIDTHYDDNIKIEIEQ